MKRCSWLNLDNKLYIDYHDNEWWEEVHDDDKLFEMLVLEWAQAGLSWEIVLNKRDNYRQVFDNYDLDIIVNYSEKKVEELMQNSWIIRNKLKINSVIQNAKIFKQIQKDYWSFDKYIWSYVDYKQIKNKFENSKDIPAQTELSKKISKSLKQKWMSFIWPTIIYAYMQAVWIVGDHEINCFKFKK